MVSYNMMIRSKIYIDLKKIKDNKSRALQRKVSFSEIIEDLLIHWDSEWDTTEDNEMNYEEAYVRGSRQ